MDLRPLRRHRDYRWLYAAQLVSFLGSMVTGSSLAVGLLGVAELVPLPCFRASCVTTRAGVSGWVTPSRRPNDKRRVLQGVISNGVSCAWIAPETASVASTRAR
jgi:hypothetical protein